MNEVNKVLYDGPTGYKTLIEAIAKDAKAEGMDFITESLIRSVIHYLFSKRGALSGIPYFVKASIHRFGYFVADKEEIKLRERYYVERAAYRLAFKKQLANCRMKIRYTKKKYKEYRDNSTAEKPLPYKYWKIGSGRKKVIDRSYRKLNKIRRDWMKKEATVFNYVTMKERKKKYKY